MWGAATGESQEASKSHYAMNVCFLGPTGMDSAKSTPAAALEF